MDTKAFGDKKVDTEFAKFLLDTARADIARVEKNKGIEAILAKVELFKTEMQKLEKMEAPALISMQQRAIYYKYDIEREMQPYLAGQSYAYIFRKFSTASKYNPTKDRLTTVIAGKKKAPTAQAIESEIEAQNVVARKTEVALQAINGDLKSLLDWLDNLILNMQNRIREKSQDRRASYAENNSQQR